MNEQSVQSETQKPKTAVASLVLGIISLVVLAASVPLGIYIESMGIVSFFNYVTLLALAAIICGIIARGKSAAKNLPVKRTATAGLILGVISLSLTILIRIAIFLFFIPWLGA